MRREIKTWTTLVWALFAILGASQAAVLEVGLIESFDGPPEHYVLTRGTENIAVEPSGRLMRGDRIELKFEHDRMTIWLFEPGAAKKSVIVLSKNTGPYVVEGKPPENGISQQLSGIWQWAAQELGFQEAEQRDKSIAEASIRDLNAIGVPLLTGAQVLAAGPRSVSIAWPSHVIVQRIEITGPSGEKIAAGVPASHAWTSPVSPFAPGVYTVSIIGLSGATTSSTITIVPASSLPKFPEQASAAELPLELVDTLRATWIAHRSPSRFALESYQIIAPIADQYHPAKLLKQALIEGALKRKQY